MTIVIVGAASGIGEATARELVGRGRLLLVDKDFDGAKRLAAQLAVGANALNFDLCSAEDVSALAARIGNDLEALIITAGLSPSMASGRRIYDVNLIGAARLLQAMEPCLRRGSAAVVLSSVSAYYASNIPEVNAVLDDPLAPDFFDRLIQAGVDPDDRSAYGFSKLGIQRLVRRLAFAWGARGARIMSLSPSTIDTPMSAIEMAANPIMQGLIRNRPLGRTGGADEIAKVIAFLVSDDASYMTGSDVLVDGGMVSIVPEKKGVGLGAVQLDSVATLGRSSTTTV